MTHSKRAWILHASPDPFIAWLEESTQKEFAFHGTDENPFFQFALEMGIEVQQAGPGTWVCEDDAVLFNTWARELTMETRKYPDQTLTRKQLLALARTLRTKLYEENATTNIRDTVETALAALEVSA